MSALFNRLTVGVLMSLARGEDAKLVNHAGYTDGILDQLNRLRLGSIVGQRPADRHRPSLGLHEQRDCMELLVPVQPAVNSRGNPHALNRLSRLGEPLAHGFARLVQPFADRFLRIKKSSLDRAADLVDLLGSLGRDALLRVLRVAGCARPVIDQKATLKEANVMTIIGKLFFIASTPFLA